MQKGTIIGDDARLSDFPGALRPERVLERGEAVEILETWHRVRAGEREGFVPGDAITLDPQAPDAAPAPMPAPGEETPAPSGGLLEIVRYQGKAVAGDSPIVCDLDFRPALERLDRYASESGVCVFVTHSLRRKDRRPSGAVVPPAKRSNHLVGHAIDMNLFMGDRNPWFNSKGLRRANLPNLPQEVRNFIERVRDDDVLRWGGDFFREDPVHIDDNFYGRSPELWMKKFESLG